MIHVHNQNRVLAFHRWVEGVGKDVVVVASLNENNWYNYQVGFPGGGGWAEVFNSDVYDNWVNPSTAGNGGGIDASGPPLHDQLQLRECNHSSKRLCRIRAELHGSSLAQCES